MYSWTRKSQYELPAVVGGLETRIGKKGEIDGKQYLSTNITCNTLRKIN